MSKMQDIIDNRKTALETIKVDDGFNYDIAIATKEIKYFGDLDNYPSAVIFVDSETRESLTLGYENITAELRLRVRGIVKADKDLDEVAENFKEDVEKAMCNDRTCGGYADLIAPGDFRMYQANIDQTQIFDFDFIVNYQYLYGSP